MIPYTPFMLRIYQNAVDSLDMEWVPETYYTLMPGCPIATATISYDLLNVVRPILGEVVCERTRLCAQQSVDVVVRARMDRNEILIWSDEHGKPHVIDSVKVVQSGEYSYRLAPYLDRTAIMQEVMERLEKTQ